ncbi:MAG: FtsX-like permease family protein [Capsulimonadales bacterium]|nr:FtsX-like permease family protein [Capsulimonadales bacterium]
MRFETQLAIRHLAHGGGQTALTVAAVAMAVTVIIFINSLITGVQERILKDLLGSLPHITVKPLDDKPRILAKTQYVAQATDALLGTNQQKQVQQRSQIENWKQVEQELAQYPDVRVIASAVRGNAFLIRGAKRLGVTVSGGDPPAQEKIVGLQENMIAGRWLDIGPEDCVLGWRLADEAGVNLGDRVRIESAQGVVAYYRIAGIFDTGNNQADFGQVYVNLRAAQSLFATNQEVSSILIRLNDPFRANEISDHIAASLPYKTESWMREQAFIVNAFQSQNSTRIMICGFALMASAFGIASVLIVSVVQKSKQIGILKSMGAKDRQILITFTLEGLFISLLGSAVGSVLGFLMLKSLENIPQAARFGKADKLFNIIYDPEIFLSACGAAIAATLLAAILPARRAAGMNPVEVIRGA